MSGSSFGSIFKLVTFGESHGLAIGGVIDGVPSNIEIDFKAIQLELDKRKPGHLNRCLVPKRCGKTLVFLAWELEAAVTYHENI